MTGMQLSAAGLGRLARGDVDGAPEAAVIAFTGITTDSRDVVPGGAFVAVRGEQMDGHRFVPAAVAAGAACALVDHGYAGERPAVLVRVPDTAAALRTACRARLTELGATVVGITGSVGKTTAKEMTAHLLGPRAARTPGNLNTWTGIPLAVLRLDPPVDVLVAEMGMSARGEIADLCSFTEPTVGVLLNIGLSHLELLGSQAAIAAAKAELLDAIQQRDGHAVVNADDRWVRRVVAERPGLAVTWYTTAASGAPSPAPVVRALEIESLGLRGVRFRLVAQEGARSVTIPVPGTHLAATAAAATAVALHLGHDLDAVVERLGTLAAVEQRGTIRPGLRGATVIDDSYNAAPASMAAALELLRASGSTERVAVLGDMLELGAAADEAHSEVGRLAAGAATHLIAVGGHGSRMRAAAVAAGLSPDRAVVVADAAAAAAEAVALCGPDTAILVKASHGLHLEQVVARLVLPVTEQG